MGDYIADYLNALPIGSVEHGEVLSAFRAIVDPKRGGKAPQLRHVTNRVGIPSTYGASVTTQMSRSWQISYVPIRTLKIGWPNWGVDISNAKGLGVGAETGPGGPMAIYASVEYPKGTFTQITWGGGNTSGTIADGATGESDLFDLGFTIPPFRWFRIAVHTTCAAGTWNININNSCDRAHGDEFQFNAANNTMNATVAGSGTTSAMLPLYVLARSDLGVWGSVGDSLLGSIPEDSFPDPSGGRGIFGRAFARFGPHVNYGVNSDRASNFVASHDKRIAALLSSGVTRMLDEYGINDLSNGRTSAQLLTDKASIRGYIPNVPWFECTTQPKTTGTFATAAGQTAFGQNAARITHNNAIRAGIAGVEGFIDVASIVETSTTNELGPVKDGGVWLPGLTADGTHQTVRGGVLIATLAENLLAVHGA